MVGKNEERKEDMEMDNYKNEVLELQQLEEHIGIEAHVVSSTPLLTGIVSGVVGGTAGAAWFSSPSFGCA